MDEQRLVQLLLEMEDRLEAKLVAKLDARLDDKLHAMEDRLEAKFDAKLDAKLDAMDAKLDAKLDAMDAKLDAKLNAKLSEERQLQMAFLKTTFAQFEQKMAVMEQNLRGEIAQLREDLHLRSDQIENRQKTADGNWKPATRWGVRIDSHRMKNDEVVTGLLRDVIDLKERVRALEKHPAQ